MGGMETSKDKVLAWLEQHKGQFVSGAKLAEELGVSRNSVWKAVRALQAGGYHIESVTGKGYRLDAGTSILSAASIERYLAAPGVHVHYHALIDSTNLQLKRLAEAGAPEGTLVVADQQSAGRGRQGRAFFSPSGTGLYFSLLLRPTFSLEDVALVTSYTAVAVAEAIESVFGLPVQIKWVNDIFVGGHKVCGILTEASFDAENGQLAYAVVGIGINVFTPAEGFPADVADVAHAISPQHADAEDTRARLVAAIVDNFMADYARVPERPHLAAYRERSLLDGRSVEVFEGPLSYRAKVLGVNGDLTLQVQLADGTERALVSGEVHIPSSQL